MQGGGFSSTSAPGLGSGFRVHHRFLSTPLYTTPPQCVLLSKENLLTPGWVGSRFRVECLGFSVGGCKRLGLGIEGLLFEVYVGFRI